ncbi:dexamethasone-induced Ras-related protein 1-like [Tubulanus polymorphus]|uniref:dexamethasone-induced Ras-related protein 1-like n=1 Tax=Tubulanus polymorphus TaxID=672921 RepID=UPI003DA57617
MALVNEAENAPPKNCHRLVIVGSAKVGKTSIVQRFLYNRYDEKYTPTIEDFHRKVYRIRGEPYRLDILDTSGNHPFPAMRRLSLLTGDLFILVFAVDSQESYEEVLRLREQICESKGQTQVGKVKGEKKKVPMVIVGNKMDKDRDKVVDTEEVQTIAESDPCCAFLETSAKKNVNINEIFVKLFMLASLPTEMSPSLHRKVQPNYVSSSGSSGSTRRVTIRRRLSDACGAVAPNVRRPSIRTDLKSLEDKDNISQTSEIKSDSRCVIQ